MRFQLDAENDGCDEILVGDSIEEVTQDVLNRYERDELPEGWTITEITEVIEDQQTSGKLKAGTVYDVDALEFDRWSTGDAVYGGVSYHEFFDADGKYLGPDEDGVEPVFA